MTPYHPAAPVQTSLPFVEQVIIARGRANTQVYHNPSRLIRVNGTVVTTKCPKLRGGNYRLVKIQFAQAGGQRPCQQCWEGHP